MSWNWLPGCAFHFMQHLCVPTFVVWESLYRPAFDNSMLGADKGFFCAPIDPTPNAFEHFGFPFIRMYACSFQGQVKHFSPMGATGLLQLSPRRRCQEVLPSAPLPYLVMAPPAHRIIQVAKGLDISSFSFVSFSMAARNVLTLTCTCLTAFSALPLHSDSPTGLLMQIVLPSRVMRTSSCTTTMEGSWSDLTCTLASLVPQLSMSLAILLGNHDLSP